MTPIIFLKYFNMCFNSTVSYVVVSNYHSKEDIKKHSINKYNKFIFT